MAIILVLHWRSKKWGVRKDETPRVNASVNTVNTWHGRLNSQASFIFYSLASLEPSVLFFVFNRDPNPLTLRYKSVSFFSTKKA
ncbi:hypothetical protein N7539_008711 [Penicillium diatomitis]|uniref:Uncharacterized protein n=1 Tax=Penicillium diatomitis TaxID=2819901 RepID=A0A9W9WRX1_9EURO|nr:uncharacterized protein N7539_008711 [Penicillium diatomitis]KAJ5472142.1 hypothetical protein N7539_008711 [Penicillium diatomitis]